MGELNSIVGVSPAAWPQAKALCCSGFQTTQCSDGVLTPSISPGPVPCGDRVCHSVPGWWMASGILCGPAALSRAGQSHSLGSRYSRCPGWKGQAMRPGLCSLRSSAPSLSPRWLIPLRFASRFTREAEGCRAWLRCLLTHQGPFALSLSAAAASAPLPPRIPHPAGTPPLQHAAL